MIAIGSLRITLLCGRTAGIIVSNPSSLDGVIMGRYRKKGDESIMNSRLMIHMIHTPLKYFLLSLFEIVVVRFGLCGIGIFLLLHAGISFRTKFELLNNLFSFHLFGNGRYGGSRSFWYSSWVIQALIYVGFYLIPRKISPTNWTDDVTRWYFFYCWSSWSGSGSI